MDKELNGCVSEERNGIDQGIHNWILRSGVLKEASVDISDIMPEHGCPVKRACLRYPYPGRRSAFRGVHRVWKIVMSVIDR